MAITRRRGLLHKIALPDPTRHNQYNETELIVEHLRDLLNTRAGEAPTVPDFGVIDFTDLVHNFPEAIQTLTKAIRDTIKTYEPRLKNVQVQHIRDDEVLVLKFQIAAHLAAKGAKGNNVRFETQLRAGGHMSVK
jgi:type VI secretion system protein